MKTLIRSLVPEPILNLYHRALAHMAAIWYRHPSRALIVVGVTGTNGKSSTVQFIGRLLEHAGYRVGWTTTASFKVAEHEWVNDQKMTMLGRFQTQKRLREMVSAGCTHAIIETSSQGILQSRHIGIDYKMAVFTNLTPEHIEAHGGFEAYKLAKGKLFAVATDSIIVNLNDEHANYFLSFEALNYGGFAIENVGELATQLTLPPVIGKKVRYESGCTTFEWNEHVVHFKPAGRFNLENALAAASAVRALGLSQELVVDGIEQLQSVPGRFERIEEGQPFDVIVDYAYEPAGLGAVYEALELIQTDGRLIHVVGSAGGGRDVARREILGKMSAEHDDIVIVTNEDPYDEDPWQIIHHVAEGAALAGKQDGVDLLRILDRQEAIDRAIDLAHPGDIVLITGKGSEPVMAVEQGKKVPWDDRVAARKALHNRYERTKVSST